MNVQSSLKKHLSKLLIPFIVVKQTTNEKGCDMIRLLHLSRPVVIIEERVVLSGNYLLPTKHAQFFRQSLNLQLSIDDI